MGLFNNNSKKADLLQSAPLWRDDPAPVQPVDYNSVLEYLQGLSDEDYAKVTKVATIYRKANADACAALGIEFEPTAAIVEPEPEEQLVSELPESINLDDDDELDIAFLEDEPETAKTKATKETK